MAGLRCAYGGMGAGLMEKEGFASMGRGPRHHLAEWCGHAGRLVEREADRCVPQAVTWREAWWLCII